MEAETRRGSELLPALWCRRIYGTELSCHSPLGQGVTFSMSGITLNCAGHVLYKPWVVYCMLSPYRLLRPQDGGIGCSLFPLQPL